MTDVESSVGMLTSPVSAGRVGRPPVLMKIRGAVRPRVPAVPRTSTAFGPMKHASPTTRSNPVVAVMRRSLPERKLSTMFRFRWRTAAMSTVTAPARTP